MFVSFAGLFLLVLASACVGCCVGVVINKKSRCVKITCKAAVDRIHSLAGGQAQYVLETARPDLVVFRFDAGGERRA